MHLNWQLDKKKIQPKIEKGNQTIPYDLTIFDSNSFFLKHSRIIGLS
jgi:hypothetical protein